jgi:hypothetical protein
MALGNAAYKILSNIILEKISHILKKNMGDYQNGFRDGRIDNVFALKIINEKIWAYNQSVQYILIFKRHMTLYTETCYGNVWKNLKSLQN